MGINVLIEPLVVVTILFGSAWVNRNKDYNFTLRRHSRTRARRSSLRDEETSSPGTPVSYDSHDELLAGHVSGSPRVRPADSRTSTASATSTWRTRKIRFLGVRKTVWTPNTKVFEDRWLSRVIRKFPFLREAWYWALIYWIYQLGRAFTALTLVQGTVHVARHHALQVIRLEKAFHIFWELPIQRYFLSYPFLMAQIDRIYCFIHIPGTILFLSWLYWYTATRRHSPTSPQLYEARRRTMATCNLLSFILFTLWPCMPPRLLSDPTVTGPSGDEARSYGFVDTVHMNAGHGSVWTTNKFCNQYAAMPSLHFGYSALIGVTVATIPLGEKAPRWRRLACVAIGIVYPSTILVAIIATANHFILDAVAGALVCTLAWKWSGVLLNLMPLEDAFTWCIRVHFPSMGHHSDGVGDGVVEKEFRASLAD